MIFCFTGDLKGTLEKYCCTYHLNWSVDYFKTPKVSKWNTVPQISQHVDIYQSTQPWCKEIKSWVMTSFKWCPCSGTGRSVGCNRLVLSRDLITECQLLLQMHIYQIDILIRCAILVIKPNRKTIQQGFVQYQGWRLQTFNDIMNLGYALLKYYHFLYYLSSLKNISIKKSS